MTNETLRPNEELSDIGLVVNNHLDHDEDPDVSNNTVSATDAGINTEWGGDFPTPTGALTNGAELQEFRVGVVKFNANTGDPTARIELWENGVLVRAGPNTSITSTFIVLSFKWDASELSGDGSLVQCKLIGIRAGGSPSKKNSVNIGHMEWNNTYSITTTTEVDLALGTYTLDGNILNIILERIITLDLGEYALVGQSLDILLERAVGLDLGSYELTGYDLDITFEATTEVNLDIGAYIVAGPNINILLERTVNLALGSYVLTGREIDIVIGTTAANLSRPILIRRRR